MLIRRRPPEKSTLAVKGTSGGRKQWKCPGDTLELFLLLFQSGAMNSLKNSAGWPSLKPCPFFALHSFCCGKWLSFCHSCFISRQFSVSEFGWNAPGVCFHLAEEGWFLDVSDDTMIIGGSNHVFAAVDHGMCWFRTNKPSLVLVYFPIFRLYFLAFVRVGIHMHFTWAGLVPFILIGHHDLNRRRNKGTLYLHLIK